MSPIESRSPLAHLLGVGLRCLLLLCLSRSLMACQAHIPTGGQLASVKRVVSGNTLEVLLPSETTLPGTTNVQSVRLEGIDAPDLRQTPWGTVAQKRLTELIGDRPVHLELQDPSTDPYGRLWAMVWCDDILLNERLVAEGHALVQPAADVPYRDRLLRAQERARLMGLGIWDPDHPLRQTPQEFRSISAS